ncbi:uncharacterized protein B0J16DRAFT_360625 [Fusarium flagelliforme]|uniref:uncharacterized protein n=1 Tax=Fusarium flagelliforme TaxID=2675880 RepID=UPI001E8CD50D|nr:uncharacterized protein B0J16DRAFT_360625 [Fusarium flagelliforme]KAH7199065.1 hypothetical protein B0J16DRAFT_360625 [Fusarium flagelliforme]
MRSSKTFCAPIYREPSEIREFALQWLDTLGNTELSRRWVDSSIIFLNKDGSFSLNVIEENSLKARTQKASLFMANLVCPPGCKALPEEQRLHLARCRLLVSLLAHAWLWGRPRVLDHKGSPVAYENRQVLSPQQILDFLGKFRASKASCTDKEIREFLVKVPQVSLHEDTSKWNTTGVIACLKWDRSHDLHNGGPWCSCRLEKYSSPPPYDPPPYDEAMEWEIFLRPPYSWESLVPMEDMCLAGGWTLSSRLLERMDGGSRA